MDIIEIATVLSDSVFTKNTKRDIKVTGNRIDIKGTLDGTEAKGRVVVTTEDDKVGMTVVALKGIGGLSVIMDAETLDPVMVQTFGTGTASALHQKTSKVKTKKKKASAKS